MAKTKTGGDAITRAGYLLNDVAKTRWTDAHFLAWINDAQRTILAMAPSSNPTRTTHALITGHKQPVPADCYKILDIPYNTSGEIITHLPSMDTLNVADPGWMAADGTALVDHVTYNGVEKNFICYPTQASTPGSIELVYAAYPVELTATSDAVDVEDEFFNALVNYVVYRAIDQDADNTANPSLASMKYAAFIGAFPGASPVPPPGA